MTPITLGKESGTAQTVRWYITLRWFMLAAVSLPSFFTQLANEGWSRNAQVTILFFFVATVSNVVFYFLAQLRANINYYRTLAGILISCDILLVTVLIFVKGGLESRSVILYVFPILAAAPMFGRIAVYMTALSAIVLYDAQILADYFGILHPFDIMEPSLHKNATYVVETMAYISSILILSAVIADYITRRLVEKERQASKNLDALNKAQQVAKMGSWEWDKVNDITSYSDGFFSLLNVRPEDHDSRKYALLRYMHTDDRPRVKRIIDNGFKYGKAYRYDARLTLPNLPTKFIHSEVEPFVNRAGQVVKVVGTVQDVTDIKELDVAKNDFVAIASHQLRTPASSVKQYIGMLLGGYAGEISENQAKMLQTAYESNERQIIIVNDLLYVAQLDSGKLQMKPQVVDIVTLVQGIADELTPNYMASEHPITFDSRSRHFYCKIDPSLIRMVIENLVDNARKYSSPSESIIIAISQSGNNVHIAVTDHGVGIAPSDMKKLFRKFTRIENPLSSTAGGSGLGLYLCEKLIDMHAGKIEVTSKVGKGSTFTVILPGARSARKL